MNERSRQVNVSYAGGRQGPWKHEYPDATTLSVVRSDAMTHFGVADTTEGGNQVVFRLYHGGDRQDDLTGTVGDLGHDKGTLALRLVREVIAG